MEWIGNKQVIFEQFYVAILHFAKYCMINIDPMSNVYYNLIAILYVIFNAFRTSFYNF